MNHLPPADRLEGMKNNGSLQRAPGVYYELKCTLSQGVFDMRLMSIGEVASKAGIRASAIRYYERSGVLPPAARISGRRQYDDAMLKRLAVVRLAREAGFTIGEIRVLLRDFGPAAVTSARRSALAARKVHELEVVLRRTNLMRTMVLEMAKCRCTTLEECGETILREQKARRTRASQ